MSSQVISYRLSTNEVLALRQKALQGESDNQTAQRLIREALDLSTEMSTESTATLDDRIKAIVEERLSAFTANQNQLLSRLQERLQQVETTLTTSVDKPVDKLVDKTVSQSELAKRLKVDSSTLTKNRDKLNFPKWSQERDSESIAWNYLPKLKRYAAVASTELSTTSTAMAELPDN